MSALSDVLEEANTGGLSAREIARRAKELGHSMNHDTAARYLRGDHGRPDEGTLVAFAEVLGVSLRTLRAAADLPSEAIAPYVPPAESSRLSRRQRRAVDELIRAMLEPARVPVGPDPASTTTDPLAGANDAGDAAEVAGVGEGADVAELPRRAARPARRAARHGNPEPPEPG